MAGQNGFTAKPTNVSHAFNKQTVAPNFVAFHSKFQWEGINFSQKRPQKIEIGGRAKKLLSIDSSILSDTSTKVFPENDCFWCPLCILNVCNDWMWKISIFFKLIINCTPDQSQHNEKRSDQLQQIMA